jgi:ribosomal protein S18 acetylase RimI-like enzyme
MADGGVSITAPVQKSGFEIREANIEDSAALARVQVDSYRDSYAGLLPQSYLDGFSYDEQTADWRELLSGESPDIVYVAEIAPDEVVGYVLARKLQGDTGESEIVALHVRHANQKKGIGRELVKAAARQLKEQRSTSLKLWVLAENPARKFYERLGGKPAGQQTIPVTEDVTAEEVAYRWSRIEDLLE